MWLWRCEHPTARSERTLVLLDAAALPKEVRASSVPSTEREGRRGPDGRDGRTWRGRGGDLRGVWRGSGTYGVAVEI